MREGLNRNIWFEKNYRIIVIPVSYLILCFISYFLYPFDYYHIYPSEIRYNVIIFDVSTDIINCWLITEFSLAISGVLEKVYPWETHILKRGISQFVLLVGGTVVILFFVNSATDSFAFHPVNEYAHLETLAIWQYIFTCILVSLFISGGHTVYYFLKRWKNAKLEATQLQLDASVLKQTTLQAQLQSLKLQLDSHFLFNNFSTLTVLIEENPQIAVAFVESLSRVYRYMITNLNNDLISLKEELIFIKSYIFLLEIRYKESLEITTEIRTENMNKAIPPITLQLLIENAIKHNIVSKSMPLKIHISNDDADSLLISNNIQLLNNPVLSTRLGLENIKKRYALLMDEEVVIYQQGNTFYVRLPLVSKF